MSERRFRTQLALVGAAGFLVRLAYIVFERRGVVVNGDSYAYHQGANLLADGHGFIEPFSFDSGIVVQSADHPPLYTMYLAAFSLLGLDSPNAHRVASTFLGVGTVVLIGLIGRRLVGARVGLLAAGIAALYPNLWAYDGFLLSESMAQLLVAGTIVLAYRFWDRRRLVDAVWLGAAAGLATLSRAELALVVPLVLWPLVLKVPDLTRRERWRAAAAGSAVAGLLVTPWCAYNLTRFEEPTLLSNGFQVTLLVSSCDEVYYGDYLGYWNKACADRALAESGLAATEDRSVLGVMYGEAAYEYIGDHLGRLPLVVAARLGRTTGLYAVRQQAFIDHFPEGRETWVANSAWVSFLVLEALAVAGGVLLRRRRSVPLAPLLAPIAIALLSVAITFGNTRYRATAEPAVVLLAAVAIGALAERVSGRRPADS